MGNPKCQVTARDDDDSWEVKAFQEDTNQAMGTTWPPRSYMCTFCRREFKSAQALGGHMNVHRRDRARLHHMQSGSNNSPLGGGANSPTFIFPTHQLMENGGVCLLYALPNPNFGSIDPPSTRLAMSPYQSKSLMQNPPKSIHFPAIPQSINSSHSHSSNSVAIDYDNYQIDKESHTEEIDLELRLGPNP